MARRVPLLGGEKECLQAALDRHRDVVEWKAEGLDDLALRRSVVPSGTTMLGLVKHLAGVELAWFCETFGYPSELPPFDEQDPDADHRIESDESTADVLAYYRRSRAAADRVIADLAVDTIGTAWTGEPVTLRWVLLHMVEETARHAGHLDILRELADGATGDHRPAGE